MALDPGHGPYQPRRINEETINAPVPQFSRPPAKLSHKFTPRPNKELYHRAIALFSQLEELVDFNPAIVKDSTPKEWKASLRDLKDQLDLTGSTPEP